MKKIPKIRLLTPIFSILILFQSCTIYKSRPVTLDEASKAKTKVRVVTTHGEKLKFKRIVYEDSIYYGVHNRKVGGVRVPLSSHFIKEVKLKDKITSAILNFGIPLSIIAVGVFRKKSEPSNYYFPDCPDGCFN